MSNWLSWIGDKYEYIDSSNSENTSLEEIRDLMKPIPASKLDLPVELGAQVADIWEQK